MTLRAVPGAYKKILQQFLDCCKPFVIHAVQFLYGCRCRLARHSSAERGAIALPFAPAVYRSRGCPSLPLFFPASYSAAGGLPPLPRAAWRILGARNRGGPDPTRGPATGGTQGPTARIKRTPQHYAPATSLTPKTKQKVNRPNYTKCLFCTHGRKNLRPSVARRLSAGHSPGAP